MVLQSLDSTVSIWLVCGGVEREVVMVGEGMTSLRGGAVGRGEGRRMLCESGNGG